MDKNSITHHDLIIRKLANLSSEEFMDLGSDGLSYIKPVATKGGTALYALHSANGSHIATGQDIATLKTIAMQQSLAPMSLQ